MATFLDPLFSFGERWGTGWDAFATALYTLERDELLRHAKACSFLRRTGHCVVCAAKKGLKLCLCVLVSCALHVAGPPCTDFSPQGGGGNDTGGGHSHVRSCGSFSESSSTKIIGFTKMLCSMTMVCSWSSSHPCSS